MKPLTAKRKDELDFIHDEIALFADLVGQVSERSEESVLVLSKPAKLALYRTIEKWHMAMGDLLASIRDDEEEGQKQ